MKTRTILEALIRAVEMDQEYGHDWAPYHSADRHHRLSERQIGKFRAELLRRMDERDAKVVKWHSIEEDPPIDTPLLVMHDNGTACIRAYIHRWTGQLAYCNIDDDWGADDAERTHWRELPPPPPGVEYTEIANLFGPREAE